MGSGDWIGGGETWEVREGKGRGARGKREERRGREGTYPTHQSSAVYRPWEMKLALRVRLRQWEADQSRAGRQRGRMFPLLL